MAAVRQSGQPVGPNGEQVARYAAHLGLELSASELGAMVEAVADDMRIYELLETLPDPVVPMRHFHRDPGRPPGEGEDPFNAFIRFCEVKGAAEGPLAGKTVAVKDCIAVAGVPQTDGGRRMPYFVPTEDAVAVERLLDAGATVIGKTNMDDLAAGNGEGSYFGAARNPVNPRFSTGGSSSGSAAAVKAGMADLGLGADQAGSVRIPAAWCGLVGMKATHGLVPSYGSTHRDHTIDHIGPITRSVADSALMLEVLAGPDWRDPQWVRGEPTAGQYRSAEGRGIAGRRIGVITDALAPIGATPDVISAFEHAVAILEQLGAEIIPVTVPLWSAANAIQRGALLFSAYGMWFTHGQGFGHLGRIDPNAMAVHAAQAELGADSLPFGIKTRLITSQYLRDAYLGTHYAKGQNLRLELRRQVSELLKGVDLLVTPTTPSVAYELLDRKMTAEDRRLRRGPSSTLNTCPFDLTGHPALTLPCGFGDHDLPVGLQIAGRHFDETLVYEAGFAVEQAIST